jgi:hypothetical protein
MIEEAIYTKLSGTAALIALVPAAQITYRLLKQNSSYPAIRYFKVSEVRESAMGTDPGLVHARWQFDVYDPSANNVRNAREQLRLALERWRGTNLGGTGLTVQDTFIESEIDHPEPELLDAKPVYRGLLEAMIHYTE